MQTTTVFIVRHGQTEWNLLGKMQGHQDSSLTLNGERQGDLLGKVLATVPLAAIYSSTSRRALHTAELIAGERKIPLIQTEDLQEIHLGAWEGKTKEEVQLADPEQYHYFWNSPADFQAAGSETFASAENRAKRALERVISAHHGEAVLLVTHSVIVKLLMAYFEQRPLQELWLDPYIHPGSLCKIDVSADGRSEILLHADINHLSE